MALVGSYVALSKPLVAALPIFLLGWLRFGIGAVAMAGWLRKPEHEPPLTAQTHRLLFVESLLGNFLFSIFMLFGVTMTTAVSAGVIMASIPAVVAVLSWAFLGERIGARIGSAVVCSAMGVGLLALAKGTPADTSTIDSRKVWIGNLLVFGAVLCEAAYAVIGKKLTGAMGPKRISAVINLWGFALMTPLGLYAAWGFDFYAISPGNWGLLVFYALAASVWTVWLWMTGLRQVPAAQAGIFTVMLPVSAVLVGVVLLGESISVTQTFAFGWALAGLLLATIPDRPIPIEPASPDRA